MLIRELVIERCVQLSLFSKAGGLSDDEIAHAHEQAGRRIDEALGASKFHAMDRFLV